MALLYVGRTSNVVYLAIVFYRRKYPSVFLRSLRREIRVKEKWDDV